MSRILYPAGASAIYKPAAIASFITALNVTDILLDIRVASVVALCGYLVFGLFILRAKRRVPKHIARILFNSWHSGWIVGSAAYTLLGTSMMILNRT